MGCSSKINSLDMLKAENIISDVRVIQDFQRFDDANLRLTEFAKKTYGLMPVPGELLYSVSDKKVNGTTVYRAEPNELLFSVLDNLIDEQETKLMMQQRDVSNEDEVASFMRKEQELSLLEQLKNYLKEEDYRLKSPAPSWITDPTTTVGRMLEEINIPIVQETLAFLREQNRQIQELKSNADKITKDLYKQAGINPDKLLQDESTQLENVQRATRGELRLPTPELDKLNALKTSNRDLYEQIEDLGDQQFQLTTKASRSFQNEVKKFFDSLMEYEQIELGTTPANVFENIDLNQTEYYGENNESVPVMVDGVKVGDLSYGLSGNYAVINFANIPDEYKKSGVLKNALVELAEAVKADGLTLVSDALDPLTNMVWAELIMDNQAHINEDLVYAYGEGPVPMNVKADLDIERSAILGSLFAEKLSAAMKTPYQQITREQASQILKNAPIKYNGEPAFVYGGTVYFIEGGLSLETALHEFSHPLITAIRRDNNKLFENLYEQLMLTEEGEALRQKMARLYPELPEGSVLYKEEILVHALSKRATNQINEQIESDGFSRFIRNLLYAIKQALKGIFGRVNVADINANTTLDELANKVLTEQFDFASTLTDEDLVQFARAERVRINKLDNTSKNLAKNISADAMIAIINDFFFKNKEVMDVARKVNKKSPQYKILEKAMFENEGQRLIKDVQSSVRKFQTVQISAKRSRAQIVDDTVDAEIRRLQELTLQATTVVYSFSVINNVMDNIYDSLNEMVKNNDYTSRQSEKLLAVFNSTVTAYDELIKDTDALLVRDFAMRTDNPFAQMLNQTSMTIQRCKNLITEINFEKATEFYKEYTKYMTVFVNKQLKENLDQLSSRLSEDEINDL